MSSIGSSWNHTAGLASSVSRLHSKSTSSRANRSAMASIVTSMARIVGSNRQRCRYQLWSVIQPDGLPTRSLGGGF